MIPRRLCGRGDFARPSVSGLSFALGRFKTDEFEEHYATTLTKLVQTKVAKVKGQAILAPFTCTGKVVDLMEAVKRDLEDEAGAEKKQPPERRKQASVVCGPAADRWQAGCGGWLSTPPAGRPDDDAS